MITAKQALALRYLSSNHSATYRSLVHYMCDNEHIIVSDLIKLGFVDWLVNDYIYITDLGEAALRMFNGNLEETKQKLIKEHEDRERKLQEAKAKAAKNEEIFACAVSLLLVIAFFVIVSANSDLPFFSVTTLGMFAFTIMAIFIIGIPAFTLVTETLPFGLDKDKYVPWTAKIIGATITALLILACALMVRFANGLPL